MSLECKVIRKMPPFYEPAGASEEAPRPQDVVEPVAAARGYEPNLSNAIVSILLEILSIIVSILIFEHHSLNNLLRSQSISRIDDYAKIRITNH